MKRTGITRSSPACSNCWVKQKHSVLLKNADADDGAIDGTAWPTIALSDRFAAWKVAPASSTGCTFISNVSAENRHGSREFTLAHNCTVNRRFGWGGSTAVRRTPAGPRTRGKIAQTAS